MTKREMPLPPIRLMKAACSTFGTGYCWSANNPYYSGHYATKERAASAAVRTKRRLRLNGESEKEATDGQG